MKINKKYPERSDESTCIINSLFTDSIIEKRGGFFLFLNLSKGGFMKKPKRALQILNLLLIINITAIMHVNNASAQESHVITPKQGFDYVVLLSGNSINITTTQATPLGVHSIWLTSIGNWNLTANMQRISSSASGFWFLSLMGTGGQKGRDFSLGVIPATSPPAEIEIGADVSFAFVTVFLYVTSQVDVDNPIEYTIRITP